MFDGVVRSFVGEFTDEAPTRVLEIEEFDHDAPELEAAVGRGEPPPLATDETMLRDGLCGGLAMVG